MKTQIITDLDAIFTDGLALDITHTYNGGGSSETLKAFFDNPYDRALARDDIAASRPSILVRTSEAGNIAKGSEFTISEVTYYLTEPENDQDGVTLFYISEDQIQ